VCLKKKFLATKNGLKNSKHKLLHVAKQQIKKIKSDSNAEKKEYNPQTAFHMCPKVIIKRFECLDVS